MILIYNLLVYLVGLWVAAFFFWMARKYLEPDLSWVVFGWSSIGLSLIFLVAWIPVLQPKSEVKGNLPKTHFLKATKEFMPTQELSLEEKSKNMIKNSRERNQSRKDQFKELKPVN